jgi:hypothetical protein
MALTTIRNFMVTYSAAPLESSTVARIAPHPLRGLFPTENIFSYKVLAALGLGRAFDRAHREAKESEEGSLALFRAAAKESDEFLGGVGYYITEDIIKTLSTDTLIAKISITNDEIIHNSVDVLGGVYAVVIPTVPRHESISLSSGGVGSPAYFDGVGVSVLPNDYAFYSFAETLYTLAGITLGEFDEHEGTSWKGGNNIAVTLYRSLDEKIHRVNQIVLRKDGDEIVIKEAEANDDGYISIHAWNEVEKGENVLSSFVYRAHERFADKLNEIQNLGNALAVVGVEEGSAYDEYNNEKFNPSYIEGTPEFIADGVFSDPQLSIEDGISPTEDAAESADEPEIEPETQSFNDVEWDSEQHEDEPDVTTDVVTSVEEINTPEDLVNFAEYEVTHSEEPEVVSEVNDPTAETVEPFALGAEYLIHEVAVDEPEYVSAPEPLDDSALSFDSDFTIAADAAENAEDIQWSDVVSGEQPIIDDGYVDYSAESNTAFDDISWDEVAVTVADNDEKPDEKPLRGFLSPN